MKLTIHRGTHQIGGSCVELSTAACRLVIDVGLPLDAIGEPTESQVRRLAVPGLFADGPRIEGILLSHAHGDHSGLIVRSRPEIPVWLSRGTSKMLMAGSLFARQADVPRERQRICRHGVAFKLGPFRIVPLNVDHSTFDSLAFLIEADGKRLLYSGDLRLHGRKGGMTRELIAAATAQALDVVVMEGTHLGKDRLGESALSEAEMENAAVSEARDLGGLVFAMFSPLNIDRLVTYLRVARKTNRTLVVDPYAAFVLHLVGGQAALPNPFDGESVRILAPGRFWSTAAGRALRTRFYDRIERCRISGADIARDPNRWMVLLRPWMLETLSGGIPAGSLCLYSYWRGYLETPALVSLRRRMEASGVKFEPLHASGHIYRADIERLLSKLRPKSVVPIHTAAPAEFTRIFPNCLTLQDGETLEL